MTKFTAKNPVYINLDDGVSFKEIEGKLKKKLDIPVHIPTFSVVNQRKVEGDYILKESDEIVFVTLIGGG
ncbi:MAG: hypothetical protein MI740_13575 [Halanaerobiales bacterium]|nr:hypothetical protein [Halanaerobiales bacterium]